MNEVADAGGWDEHALKVIKEMKGIKKEEWGVIHETLITLKGFTDASAVEFFTSNLTESITLKFEEILAPLKNEWNDLLNTLLEPLMPMLQGLVEFLVPIIQIIATGVQWIIDLSWLPPPIEVGVMMTFDQFVQNYLQTYPLANSGGFVGWWYEQYAIYVAAWTAAQPPPTTPPTGGITGFEPGVQI